MNIIFSDDDADGILSSYIVSHLLKRRGERVKLLFQSWEKFGVTEENIKTIFSFNPTHVFFLDIGSDMSMLHVAEKFLEKNVSVTILDNHPPDQEILSQDEYFEFRTKLKELEANKNFEYFSDTENCTTGKAYLYYSIEKDVPEFIEKLTLFGLVADVVTETKEGGSLYQKLLKKYPEFSGKIYYGPKTDFSWGILDAVVGFFHIPRRILYNEAPPLAINFLLSAEKNNLDFIKLYMEIEEMLGDYWKERDIQKIVYPSYDESVRRIMECVIQWRTQWKKILERGNILSLDYNKFMISIITHEWNLGSALANLKISETRKPHFVINFIPKYQIYYVSGRGDGSIHIGKVFSQCDKNILEGGGLKNAGSAIGKTLEVDKILREIVKNTLSQTNIISRDTSA